MEDGGLPSASGAGLFFAEEDKTATFTVDVGRRKGDLRVSVSGKIVEIIFQSLVQYCLLYIHSKFHKKLELYCLVWPI